MSPHSPPNRYSSSTNKMTPPPRINTMSPVFRDRNSSLVILPPRCRVYLQLSLFVFRHTGNVAPPYRFPIYFFRSSRGRLPKSSIARAMDRGHPLSLPSLLFSLFPHFASTGSFRLLFLAVFVRSCFPLNGGNSNPVALFNLLLFLLLRHYRVSQSQ